MAESKFFQSPVTDVATAVGFVAAVAGAIFALKTIPITRKMLGLSS